MTDHLFMRDEDGVAAIQLPVAECTGYTCLDSQTVPLAMSYVPMQKYKNRYSPEQALSVGTLFEDLDKPFLGKNTKWEDGKQ